ncbi:TPA: hypothetical protein ACH3X1_004994 [Trebouxia sp. C0004]
MVLVRVHGYGVTDLTPLKALSRAQGQALMEKIRVKIAGKRNADQGHNPARLLQQVLLSTLVQLPKPDTVPALQTTPSSTRGAAEVAARNHRSETGTRVAEQVKDLWHGSNCPFDIMGIFVPHIAKDYLEDSFFRTGGFEDYFGCEDFRRILWSGYPDLEGSSSEYTGLGEPYDHIKHITAQALAFMEIKVVSLLNNQKSLPKGAEPLTNWWGIMRQLYLS